VGDAGNLTCAQGEHCCEPAQGGGVSTCAADCSAMPDGGTDWQCDDPSNCGAGSVCCAVATSADQQAGCSYHFLHGFHGTKCVTGTACAAGQIQVCEQATDCPSGTTCQTAKGKGGQFGLCL
jgi:hypothetical protein